MQISRVSRMVRRRRYWVDTNVISEVQRDCACPTEIVTIDIEVSEDRPLAMLRGFLLQRSRILQAHTRSKHGSALREDR